MFHSASSIGRIHQLGWRLLLFLLSGTPALGDVEERVVLRIEPGPLSMSAQELSITQDMLRGRQHGVILVDETMRDESRVLYQQIAHHLRAKILSNEARSLADIVIPYETTHWSLRRWWGRTILPDGTSVELAKENLKEQLLLVGPGWSTSVRKAALPGVVPGCVIDYGYELRGGDLDEWTTIPLQRSWPILALRYQWFPASWLPSQYFVRRFKLDIEVQRQQAGVFIEGTYLPPALDEPWMPEGDQQRAGADLFYSIGRTSSDPNAFWNAVATAEEKKVGEFADNPKALKKALTMLAIFGEAPPLVRRLQAAYEWLDRSIVNESMWTAEDRAAAGEKLQKLDPESREAKQARKPPAAESVLSTRRAGRQELRYLFIALARALGARAHIVMATDRRERSWERSMLSKGQLDHRVVAVRDPGAPADGWTLVDPGSGLPYGSIPWWLAPARALVATNALAEEIQIEASRPEANVMESRATISFSGEEGDAARVEWSARGSGQSGYEERLRWRTLAPAQRQEQLDVLCGASGDFEVSRAQAPDVNDLTAGYNIVCAGQMTNAQPDEAQDRFELSIAGAWFPEAPWFPSATRSLPIVFSYPHVDRTTVEVAAPPGFNSVAVPEAVPLDSPYGSYNLRVTQTTHGYRVERTFTLTALTVAVSEYDQLRAFFGRMRVADRARLEFIRSRSAP